MISPSRLTSIIWDSIPYHDGIGHEGRQVLRVDLALREKDRPHAFIVASDNQTKPRNGRLMQPIAGFRCAPAAVALVFHVIQEHIKSGDRPRALIAAEMQRVAQNRVQKVSLARPCFIHSYALTLKLTHAFLRNRIVCVDGTHQIKKGVAIMLARSVLRSARLAFPAAAISLLVPFSAQADHSWGGYHWARTGNPFTLRLGDNVSTTWDSYLATTSSDWSVSDVLDTTVVTGSTTGRTCRATSGRVQVCNYTYGSTGWLGVASISLTGGTHIVSGTVKVNDTYFNTSTYNTTAWRNLVMCQEVGHTFGLDHQDEDFNNSNLGTCMDYTNSPASNQHPNAHDYEELDIIYGHTDSTTTVSSAAATAALPPAMAQLRLDGPGQWGRVISRYSDGNPKWYELDFGRGNKILTHVFWVPGAKVDESANQ